MNSFYCFQTTSHLVSINFNEKLVYIFLIIHSLNLINIRSYFKSFDSEY